MSRNFYKFKRDLSAYNAESKQREEDLARLERQSALAKKQEAREMRKLKSLAQQLREQVWREQEEHAMRSAAETANPRSAPSSLAEPLADDPARADYEAARMTMESETAGDTARTLQY